jgi:hypothetical protein
MVKITKEQKEAMIGEKIEETAPKAKEKEPSSGGGAASGNPAFVWAGNMCECGKPVAPGQDKVCAEHIRSR